MKISVLFAHCGNVPQFLSHIMVFFSSHSAYVGLSARMGVDGGLGRAGVEWATELRTSSSLDGSVHLQEGHGLRVALNTPEDLMDIVSLR